MIFLSAESEMTDDLDVDAMLEAPFKKEVSGICINCIFFFLFIVTFQGNFLFLIYDFINIFLFIYYLFIFPVLVMKYVNLSVYFWSNYKKSNWKNEISDDDWTTRLYPMLVFCRTSVRSVILHNDFDVICMWLLGPYILYFT